MTQTIQIFKVIVTAGLLIALFFISYFVIKIILKSRNTYFATIRMLGATKKISKQLLDIELFIIYPKAYYIRGQSCVSSKQQNRLSSHNLFLNKQMPFCG
jgi:hypothetical protein